MGALMTRCRSELRGLWADKPRLYFTLAFLLAAGGTITTMGGLAALTNFCLENQPTGLAKGFKTDEEWKRVTAEVMRSEKATSTSSTGNFQCDMFFRFDWFLWALQVVWLAIVGLCWYLRTLHRYLPALIGLGATVTAWHFEKINHIISMEQYTKGVVHTSGIITAGGLIFTSMGNLFLFFAACWYAPQMAPPRREMEGAMRKTDSTFTKHTNSSFAAKNGNGGGSDSQRDVVGVAQVV